jgi:hypothetical protein
VKRLCIPLYFALGNLRPFLMAIIPPRSLYSNLVKDLLKLDVNITRNLLHFNYLFQLEFMKIVTMSTIIDLDI